MHRLGVYRIRLPKNYTWKHPRYRTLVWRVTDGDGDGDGDGHSICLRTLIHQTQGLSADVIGRTPCRQSSADSRLSLGVLKVWIVHQTSTRKDIGSLKPERHRQVFSATHTVRAQYCQLARYNKTNSICPRTPGVSGAKKLDIYIPYLGSPNEGRGSDTLTLI